jgi:hypothetical protein
MLHPPNKTIKNPFRELSEGILLYSGTQEVPPLLWIAHIPHRIIFSIASLSDDGR